MVAMFRLYLPNFLTLLRIAVTPLIVASLFYAEWLIAGLLLFCAAMLSDYYDGYYARKFEVVSKLGIFLDPLADKVLVLSLFGAFCVKAAMAWWMFGLILVRELMVTFLRMIMIQYGFMLKTSQSGKIKVVIQFFLLYMLFFQQILGCDPSLWKVYGFWVDGLVSVSIYAALGITVFSGLQYLYDNRAFFKFIIKSASHAKTPDIFLIFQMIIFFIARMIATVCGLGYSPYAPGTVGSFAALICAWWAPQLSIPVSLAIIVIVTVVGVWASSLMIKYTGDSDPRVVVIDEVVGMWLALVCVPKRFACYAVAFIAFRILDIAKPFPINWAERLPGGIGVMADDLVAGAIALVFIQLVCLPYLI